MTNTTEHVRIPRALYDALILWAYCPYAGGYRNGPDIEDTCEHLAAEVFKFTGIWSEDIDNAPTRYWPSVEETLETLANLSTNIKSQGFV